MFSTSGFTREEWDDGCSLPFGSLAQLPYLVISVSLFFSFSPAARTLSHRKKLDPHSKQYCGIADRRRKKIVVDLVSSKKRDGLFAT